MVFRFLLHDSYDMSVGGVSGERKQGIWGENCARKNWQQYGKIRTIKQTCSKLNAVVALANFQQKE
jgi:hypothetical protein